MIKHIAMWKLRGSAPGEKAETAPVKHAFEGLSGRSPGLRHIEIGLDGSRADYACDVVQYREFDSQEALDAYADHPEHLRVRTEPSVLRIARHQVDHPAPLPFGASASRGA